MRCYGPVRCHPRCVWMSCRSCLGSWICKARRFEAILMVELPPAETAPILKQCLLPGPGFARSFFVATPAASLQEFEGQALRHPVFQVNTIVQTNASG